MKILKKIILSNKLESILIGISITGSIIGAVKGSSQSFLNWLFIAIINLLVIRENLLMLEINRLNDKK